MSETAVKRVPLGQKVAFGFGMLANQMFPAVLGIFMVVLVQNLGFPGWMWGVIYFFPRIFDSFTDPIMGFISDNTRSKWGRRRQYVFVGALVMGVSFIMMWQLYAVNGIQYNFIYFMFWSFLFYLGLTVFSVPYVAMGYEMSDDFHERTDIMATAQWIGQWAWVIAPWFWVIMYDNGPDGMFASAEVATRTLAIWVGIFLMLIAMVPAIFINSESTLEKNYSEMTLKNIKGSFNEIILGFKEALKIKQFRKLCIATFFIFNAFNTVATFTFFVVVYHLFNGDTQAAGIWPTLFGSLGALATTFIVIPVITKMSHVLGKKKAFLWAQGISIIGYVLLWFLFIPGKPYMFIFALPFFSFGIGSLFTLMMSMTSDVLDLDELNSGKRREGIFGAIYWWMVKFGFAIAGGLSGVIISLVGFQEGVPGLEQPEAITGLRAFFSGLPIVGTLLAMYVMKDYDVTEERAREIQKLLAAKKAPITSGYGGQSVLADLDFQNLSPDDLKERFPYYMASAVQWAAGDKSAIYSAFQNSLNKGMHGICFSPFDAGQFPGDEISEEQVRTRLKILKPYTEWIRVFSSTKGHEKIAHIARSMGFKILMGAWISSDKEENNRELNALCRLLDEGLIDMAAVGNEVLFRKELKEETLIQYIQQIKNRAKGVPVGYVDIYSEFFDRPALVDACDIVMINCYPFWEGAPIAYSGLYLQEMYHRVKNLVGEKEVIITETGWPSIGEKVGMADPSPENSMRYFVETQEWANAREIDLFYFSSFDESWKIHAEGWAGTSWGLWDKHNQMKYKS